MLFAAAEAVGGRGLPTSLSRTASDAFCAAPGLVFQGTPGKSELLRPLASSQSYLRARFRARMCAGDARRACEFVHLANQEE